MKQSFIYHCKSLICQNLFLKICLSKCSWPIRFQGYLKCNPKKEVRDQVDFLYVNRHQSFLQGDTIVVAWVARHA